MTTFTPGPAKWTKSWQGWHRADWHVRPAPMSSGRWFWLYRRGDRYTATGRFADCVSFPTAKAARAFADSYDSYTGLFEAKK